MGFISKTYKIVINHLFMMNKNKSHAEKNKPLHIFTHPWSLRSGGVKIWRGLFFLNNVNIRNNDFITILGPVKPKYHGI